MEKRTWTPRMEASSRCAEGDETRWRGDEAVCSLERRRDKIAWAGGGGS